LEEDVSKDRLNGSELVRYFFLALVFVVMAGLSIVLIIALLSDWPKILHAP